MKTKLFLLFVLLIWNCGTTKFSLTPEITVNELREHIGFLASDSLKGRKPGTPESKIAAEYITNHIQNYGFEPVGDNGYQYFEVVTSVELGLHNSLQFSDFNGVVETDFIPLGFTANSSVTAPIIFAGYGFNINEDSLIWNDYSNIDVKGKWVIILRGDPELDNSESMFIPSSSERNKAMIATDFGASGVLFVSGIKLDEQDELLPLIYDQVPSSAEIPVIHITRKVANQLLKNSAITITELESSLNENRKPISFDINNSLTANTDVQLTPVTTQNIVAVLPGSDPILKNEFILLGAHYDHLGFGGPSTSSRAPELHEIHNGADDNASGVAAIIELAEKLSVNRQNIKRSILFISFGAEEMGLLGSKYFTKNPLIDLEQIKLVFNLDMVGRLKTDSKELIIGGTGTASEMEELLNTHSSGDYFTTKFSSGGYGPSDHASFYLKDIPVLFFFTGVHDEYHTPSDDIDIINFDGEKHIADFVYDLIVDVANRETNLTFQESGPKGNSGGRKNYKVKLGVVPDFTFSGNGFGIDDIVENGPAHIGGMQKGDVIISIEDKSVNNIYDYMNRMSDFKVGQRISVEVLRNNKKIILIVDL